MKITISGIGGVGKGTISKILSEKLKYKLFSGGDIFREEAIKKKMTIYEFDNYVKENSEYDLILDKKQKKIGLEKENFVLESRLGWFFIPDSVKIKLICDENERLKRLILRDGGEEEGEVRSKEIERLNAINFRYKKLYNIENFQDDKNFDLIIDTTKITPNQIVEKILEFLK